MYLFLPPFISRLIRLMEYAEKYFLLVLERNISI